MNPGEEYLAERERQRGALQTRITNAVLAFFAAQYFGWVLLCAGISTPGTGTWAFEMLASALLLVSFGAAVRAGVLTLRKAALLNWRWWLIGCLPWSITCLESLLWLLTLFLHRS